MAGLLNDLDSSALATLAGLSLEDGSGVRLSKEQIEGPDSGVRPNSACAQVYATLAVAQAVRELAEALAERRPAP